MACFHARVYRRKYRRKLYWNSKSKMAVIIIGLESSKDFASQYINRPKFVQKYWTQKCSGESLWWKLIPDFEWHAETQIAHLNASESIDRIDHVLWRFPNSKTSEEPYFSQNVNHIHTHSSRHINIYYCVRWAK